MQPVEVWWEPDAAVHRRGSSLIEQSTGRRLKVVSFLVVIVLMASVAFMAAAGRTTSASIIAAVAVGAFVMLVVLLAVARRDERKALKVGRQAGHERVETSISEVGVAFQTGEIRSELGWSEFRQASHEEGFFVLLLRSGGGCFFPLDRADPRWPLVRVLIPDDLWFEKPKEPPWS